jgi:DnaJ-class molecular chaperone
VASDKSDKQGDGGDSKEESHGPQECMPCRGSGQLISNLGGTPSTVACPWCEGSGTRMPGIDAQQTWLAQGAEGEQSSAPADAAA